MEKIIIAVHGGAGTILRSKMTAEKEKLYQDALNLALAAGYELLINGSSATDAVQAAVMALENIPLFNAGKGSVFTHEGKHEMDAAIMEGKFLKAGAICGVSNIRNPIALARAVMDHSEHILLSGKGAEEFARSHNIETESDNYFFEQSRYEQLTEAIASGTVQLDHSDKKFGTVGAVALDSEGNIAAATSTGGMTNKRFNRVGDSPIIGAGTYANNATCAISCTGHGEYFMRAVVAHDISCLMEYKGFTLLEATNYVVKKKLVNIGGEGGLIAVDARGHVCMPFNSEGMYRGYRSVSESMTAIY